MSRNRTITLQAGPKTVAAALDFVADACREWGVTQAACFKLSLAVDEAVSNILRHAYQGHAGHIELRMGVKGSDVWIELRDWGPFFDPTTVPEPSLQAPLEKREVGGLGIHLMRQAVDELVYRREGDVNILRMVKRGALP